MSVLPGIKSPTILPLANNDWCSIHTVIEEKRFWEIIGRLRAEGAEGINGLMLSNAMHLSGFTGQPVELPFDEDLFYEELQKRVQSSKKKDHVVEITAKMDQSWRR